MARPLAAGSARLRIETSNGGQAAASSTQCSPPQPGATHQSRGTAAEREPRALGRGRKERPTQTSLQPMQVVKHSEQDACGDRELPPPDGGPRAFELDSEPHRQRPFLVRRTADGDACAMARRARSIRTRAVAGAIPNSLPI